MTWNLYIIAQIVGAGFATAWSVKYLINYENDRTLFQDYTNPVVTSRISNNSREDLVMSEKEWKMHNHFLYIKMILDSGVASFENWGGKYPYIRVHWR